jgi:Kef-type K+ transport system membrane component KefB
VAPARTTSWSRLITAGTFLGPYAVNDARAQVAGRPATGSRRTGHHDPVSFGILALIVGCGLAGPLLAFVPRLSIPVVVGEIAAGAVVGRAGFAWIDPADVTLAFLAQVGFVLLMFVVGTRLPLREPDLRGALVRGGVAFAATCALAVPSAVLLASVTSLHEVRVLLLLLTTSSAAVALPILQGKRAGTPPVALTAWILVADVATIAALPILLAEGSAVRVAEGALLVTGAAALMLGGALRLRGSGVVRALRKRSKKRHWALDLRIALVALFALAWIASRFGTSVLVAGFVAGAIVAAVGEPRRLVQQTLGVAEGFLVPVFFVVLGARLDVRSLLSDRSTLALTGVLAAAVVAVHVLASAVARLGLGAGLVAAAQLGVPSAVVAIGIGQHRFSAAVGAAIVAASLVSLVSCSIGAALLGRAAPVTPRRTE